MLLPLYLRREPTTDTRAPSRLDVVAYRDPACTARAARWPWFYKRPRRGSKTVMFNCWRWRAVWLPDA